MTLVMVVYALWGFTDVALFPAHAREMLWIRVAVIGVIGIAVALTYLPIYQRARAWIIGTAGVATAYGLLLMTLLSPREIAPHLYSGIGIAIFGISTLFLLRFKPAAIITLLILAGYGIISPGLPHDVLLMGSFFLGTAAILGPLAALTIERYARESFLALRALEDERARSERLLLNVLPAPVAERLKRGEAPIADYHPEASVLFADIADFTRLSSSMSPEDLVRLLNEVFTEFDHVAARYGLEKIKTIGDAYMAVAGVPVARPDHLEAVANAAIEMRGAIERRSNDVVPLAVRIGIDTGPVVAGVIGESKFIYDLWGDPVTTASRMESHGVRGEIQVTDRVEERLRERYVLRSRGEIDVKGKGRMPAWILERRRSSSPAGARG